MSAISSKNSVSQDSPSKSEIDDGESYVFETSNEDKES